MKLTGVDVGWGPAVAVASGGVGVVSGSVVASGVGWAVAVGVATMAAGGAGRARRPNP